MGNCYFMSIYYQHRGEVLEDDHREDLVLSSEEVSRIGDHPLINILSCKAGIFFYESDLYDKALLKAKLHKLVEEVE